MADKKEIRSSLSVSETCFMILMPASQIWAWLKFLQGVKNDELAVTLRQMLPSLCIFHALWALKNRYAGNMLEKGHLTFGAVALASLMGLDRVEAFYFALAGAAMVWVSFFFVAANVTPWPATKLAHVMRKTVMWARIYKAYMLANTAFWLVIIVSLLLTRA